MTKKQTPEETKQEHLEKMGKELGTVYHALWNEVAWLHMKWDEYVELFGTKPSHIALLNRTAPLFFKVVNDALWEDTLLHLSRLTDSELSHGKHHNLTVQLLPKLVEDEEAKAKVSELIEIAITQTEFCRDWRNNHIAHRDLNRSIKKDIEPLAPASREKIDEALESIAAVLSFISEHYMNVPFVWKATQPSHGTEQLLYVLGDGIRADNEQRTKIGKGENKTGDHEIRVL